MKKIFLFTMAVMGGLQANADVIDLSFTGSFTSGPMAGQEIFGSIELNDLGIFSGDAIPLFDALSQTPGSVGILNDLSFTFFELAPPPPIPAIPVGPPTLVEFDLSDISGNQPSASFYNGALTGFEYTANEGTRSLIVSYDGTQPDLNSAISFTYFNAEGISTGTLDLPTNVVPEPSAYAAIAGVLALAVVAYKRRNK